MSSNTEQVQTSDMDLCVSSFALKKKTKQNQTVLKELLV